MSFPLEFGIIITGGGAKLKFFKEFVEEKSGLKVQLGAITPTGWKIKHPIIWPIHLILNLLALFYWQTKIDVFIRYKMENTTKKGQKKQEKNYRKNYRWFPQVFR